MIYELTSENLSGLGSRMGTERTSTNWRRYFKTIKRAKEIALRDYRAFRPEEKIDWQKTDTGVHSGDLSFVMYTIRRIKVED